MESALDYHTARALLEWQIELGATEAMLDAPVNRYEVPDKPARAKPAVAADAVAPPPPKVDPVQAARDLAARANDLDSLQQAMQSFELCDLKRGARSLVFSDGNPAARVMIIGEAPGRDEDRAGKPFVGRAGHLLDRMFDGIDMGRSASLSAKSIYITNVLPWRPPQNRDPKAHEIAMMVPFLQRHVEIVAPEVIVVMGNIACEAVLGKRSITRLRGQWDQAFGKAVLPMCHPACLLRQSHAKRDAWADLLSLQAKLREI